LTEQLKDSRETSVNNDAREHWTSKQSSDSQTKNYFPHQWNQDKLKKKKKIISPSNFNTLGIRLKWATVFLPKIQKN
jgi:hypothetical protein